MITRKQFLASIGAIIAAPFAWLEVKKETGTGFIHQINNNPSTLSDMPYPNMGIMFTKGHSKKRVSLEWADGIKYGKVKAVDDTNGKYILWETKSTSSLPPSS